MKIGLGYPLGVSNWLDIDLDALRYNARQVKALIGERCALWAVVKANAYGHSAVPIARTLAEPSSPVSRLIVASLDEAIELREAGIEVPILMLYPPTLPCEWEGAICHRVEVVIDSVARYHQAYEWATRIGKPVHAHLEIDTGMSRIGIAEAEVAQFLECWNPNAPIAWQGVFTHFVSADNDPELTRHQLESLLRVSKMLESAGFPIARLHASASAGLLTCPESHLSAVRCGLLLYGIAPRGLELHPFCQQLRPVLSWRARVLSVRTIPKGRGVSYGWRYRAERETRVATLAAGYADGYPIGLSNNSEVLLHGVRVPQVGRICMDMLMVDVSVVPKTQTGDIATLIGSDGSETIRVEELAVRLHTTPHEIPTRLGTRPARVFRGL